MPKRFTDTEKWKDEWWGSLSNDYRMIWLYLVDSCSIAGIWKKDFRGLNFNCNTNITEQEFIKVFSSRVIDRGGSYFIPKFLRYQCPKGLNSNKPAIISIVNELILNNLIQTVHESLGNDFLIIKDKDKGKGKDKDKGKNTGEGKTDPKKFVTVGDEVVYDVLPILEFWSAALNGRQKEQKLKDWKLMVVPWFNENLEIAFNDEKHVLNSFSRYYVEKGKPLGSNGTPKVKTTMEDLKNV